MQGSSVRLSDFGVFCQVASLNSCTSFDDFNGKISHYCCALDQGMSCVGAVDVHVVAGHHYPPLLSALLSQQSAPPTDEGGASLHRGLSSHQTLHVDFCNCVSVCAHVCVKSGVLSGRLENPPALFTNTD